jgi:hypothetical protein
MEMFFFPFKILYVNVAQKLMQGTHPLIGVFGEKWKRRKENLNLEIL